MKRHDMNMKGPFLALGLSAVLTACGGGSSSADEKASIADPTSTIYAASLKAVAETDASMNFLLSVGDLLDLFSRGVDAAPGQCFGDGTISSYAAPTLTLTQCGAPSPGKIAYTGTSTGNINTSSDFGTYVADVNVTAINAVKAYKAGTPPELVYTMSSGRFVGKKSETSVTNTTYTVVKELTSGPVVINAGTSSVYTLRALNSKLTYTYTQTATADTLDSLNASYVNASNPMMTVEKVGTATTSGVTYDVALNGIVQTVGDNTPSAGSVRIAFSTTTGCSPIVLTYQASNRFNMSCGGHSITKSWTDADVVAARIAAVQ